MEWGKAQDREMTSAELRLHLRQGTFFPLFSLVSLPLGTFFLIAEATRHHACAALPTPAFIGDQNLIAVTMTCMAV